MNSAIIDENDGSHREETLQGVFHRLILMVIFPDASSSASTSLLQRIKIFVSENGPRLGEAARNIGQSILLWTLSGNPLRALLLISVGTINLVILTGLLVFILFTVAATVNAIIISLVISSAAAGGFWALLFAYVTTIYIGALSVAAFVISNATISAIIAVVVATGSVGLIWGVWLGTKKSMDVANHLLSIIGSALSAYSSQITYLGVV